MFGGVIYFWLLWIRPEGARSRGLVPVWSSRRTNSYLRTFIVAPLTTGGHSYPFRIPCRFEGRAGYVVLDQIRTVDRERLVRRLGKLSPSTLGNILAILQEMFTP